MAVAASVSMFMPMSVFMSMPTLNTYMDKYMYRVNKRDKNMSMDTDLDTDMDIFKRNIFDIRYQAAPILASSYIE
jgi:hypothetical protein